MFLPAVPLAVPHVQLSLELGEDLTLEQLLRGGSGGEGGGGDMELYFVQMYVEVGPKG